MTEEKNLPPKGKVVIELQDVRRDFKVGDETVHALRGVSFKIYAGELVTRMGTSGSGTSHRRRSPHTLTLHNKHYELWTKRK